MYESRTLPLKRKLRIILDRRFKEFFNYQVGDSGQGIISGIVSGEKMAEDTDGLIKTIEVENIKVLSETAVRI